MFNSGFCRKHSTTICECRVEQKSKDAAKVTGDDVSAQTWLNWQELVTLNMKNCACCNRWSFKKEMKRTAHAEAVMVILSTEVLATAVAVGCSFRRHKMRSFDSLMVIYYAGLIAYLEWIASTHIKHVGLLYGEKQCGHKGQADLIAQSRWRLHSIALTKNMGEFSDYFNERKTAVSVRKQRKYYDIVNSLIAEIGR